MAPRRLETASIARSAARKRAVAGEPARARGDLVRACVLRPGRPWAGDPLGGELQAPAKAMPAP